MNAMESNFREILEVLDAIRRQLVAREVSYADQMVDNAELLRMMRISAGTARAWRKKGKIGYTEIGKKIYYKLSDVNAFLMRHYHEAREI